MMKRLLILLLAGAAWSAQADVIELTSGQKLSGEVIGYWNMLFEVKSPEGAVKRFAQSQIKRITFETGTATLDTWQGTIQGRLTAFEDGKFAVQPAQGAATSLSASLVKEILFSGDSSSGTSGGSVRSEGDGRGGGSEKKIALINKSGSRVDVAKNLVAGKVTIVDYYADWCGPCRQIAPFLEDLAKSDPDVYLRKVDIEKWGSPVTQQYQINSIPRIEVYDRKGRQVPLSGRDRQAAIQNAVAQAKRN